MARQDQAAARGQEQGGCGARGGRGDLGALALGALLFCPLQSPPPAAGGSAAAPKAQTEEPDAYTVATSRFRELVGRGEIGDACQTLRDYIALEKSTLRRNSARGLLAQALWQTGHAGSANEVVEEGLEELVSELSEAERAGSGADVPEKTKRIQKRKPEYQRLIAYLRIQRGRAFLVLGLLDKSSDELTLAKEGLRALGGSGTNIRAELMAMRLLEGDVLASREAYAEFESAVDEFLASEDSKDPPGLRLAAQLNAHLGTALAEAARSDPARWNARARARLERSLAGAELPAMERVEPELSLCALELRAGEVKGARAHLDKADAHLGQGSARASHSQYVTFKTAQAELALAEPSEVELERLRDELAAILRGAVEQFANLELRPGGYGFLNYKDKRGLLSELFRLEMVVSPGATGRERAVDHLLSLGAASSLGRKLGAQPADLTRARSALLAGRPGSALVLYLPGPNRSHAFFVDADRVEHFELPGKDLLETGRFEAVKELRKPPPKDNEQNRALPATRALAENLLPSGLQACLRDCSRVSIVGRDLLGEVPFEALPLADGRALGVAKAVTDLPSVAVGIALVERARAERRQAAGAVPAAMTLVGAPVAAALSVRPADLEAMLGAWPSTARVLRTGTDATLAALQNLPDSTLVLQVFTHGKLDWEREEPATFLLQGDAGKEGRWCGADELREVAMPPLVLLTVCGGDMMPRRRGDGGAAGFAGTFLASGPRARCVVLSAYDIDTAAAREQSRRFYTALLSGDDPAEALRKARAALAEEPGFDDPFYYGLLRVVGAGNEPLFEQKR
ncbi:MAG: CHAT domain-containing protein [Planctomycetota bacterium]